MKIILYIFIFFSSLSVLAQQHREKIHALKISFITERLDLTEQEAQKFWPIYNEFDKEAINLRHHEIRNIRRDIKDNVNTLTDEKALELIHKINDAETKLHNNRMKMATRLLEVISPKKLILLKVAEEDFKRKMLDRFRNRHQKRK